MIIKKKKIIIPTQLFKVNHFSINHRGSLFLKNCAIVPGIVIKEEAKITGITPTEFNLIVKKGNCFLSKISPCPVC